MKGDLWSLGEEKKLSAECKMGSNLHRRSAPLPWTPQPDRLIC